MKGRMWGLLPAVALATAGCSAGYQAQAPCGQLADDAALRDVNVAQLQAQAEGGRCMITARGQDVAALARQQRMYEAVAQLACDAPAQVEPLQGGPGFVLRMPERCPLSSGTSLYKENDPRWTPQRRTAPSYPAAARAQAMQGRVRVQQLIDRDGKVRAVTVRESSGHAVLDDAAARDLRAWRYERQWWAMSLSRMSLLSTTADFNVQ